MPADLSFGLEPAALPHTPWNAPTLEQAGGERLGAGVAVSQGSVTGKAAVLPRQQVNGKEH